MFSSHVKRCLSYINTTRLQDDFHNFGLACMGVGCAGIFLSAYPKYSPSYFWTMIGIGAIFWLCGLIKKGDFS